ncbi:MAG: aspartate ammonia-lyase [Ensifer alkalisoli]|uniref:Aspartate ammonia-lyase n=2 Tax=Sinorhizobium alkalisoli TaxID=1752398 RepID=A0A1E3VE08_9HYPH|nr:aspartate ammonia-lyase [Sinorhizobium alkalisoli]ODR91764.1 aspartate ammonia-lyase [Sinorhizobium alkalisoli]QFI70472.1 Aspartate ammonia-lyase [Sinorhizobium alkalisoli]
MPNTRTDADSLGSRELPAGALYGVATLRGHENFDISFHKLGDAPELLKALARIKHAAAAANRDIRVLPAGIANAIIAASVEIENGRHTDQFIVDLLEGSGGTSINMNVNEVIANRALQILNEQPGAYSRIHPNDHVNTGQSTNDVLPAAVKLAVYDKSLSLIEALKHLTEALEERSIAFKDVLRIGRTCMQAAQPMRLGQAFSGYAAAIRRLVEKLVSARDDMLVLPLGGTAIGTGLGSAPGYRSAVYRHLKEIVGADVRPGANMFDAMQNADAFARVSSEIRISAEVIGKIASDLIILASGLNSGVAELRLPSVQPGSSIMPGKINPVLPMMMQQVAFAVVGNDAAVSLASRQGQLEINHFEPIIASRLFDSIELLAKSTRIFADKCIAGIEADREQSFRNLMQSSALATALVPKLGYAEASKLVQASAAERRPFMQVAIERGLLTHDEVLEVVRESADHREEIA